MEFCEYGNETSVSLKGEEFYLPAKETGHLGDLGVDGRSILRNTVEWAKLTQDGDQWRTLVSTVLKIHILQKAGNFLTS